MLSRAWETNPIVRRVDALSPLDRERLLAAGIVFTGFVALIYLYLVDPVSKWFPFKDPVHLLTGLYNPGCGSSRALHALLHGQIWSSIRYNPLTVGYVPFFAYAYSSQFSILVRGKPFARVFIPAFWIWLLLAVIIVFTILRNIPAYPFTLLAPWNGVD